MPINQGYREQSKTVNATTAAWDARKKYTPPSGGGETTPPTPAAPPKGPTSGDTLRGPGSIEVNVMDPSAAIGMAAQESTDVFTGLRQFVFGQNDLNVLGSHGGLVGDIPILGDAGRVAVQSIQNAPGIVADVIGGTLEHISAGVPPDVREQFEAIKDEEAKAAVVAQIAKDGGEGILSPAAHYMTEAIRADNLRIREEEKNPDLWDGLWVENASMADVFTNMFGWLQVTQRGAERLWAGMETPGQGGRNRLEAIVAVGRGEIAFNEDKGVLGTGLFAGGGGGLSPEEQTVYDMYTTDQWTETQALDYLASHNAGISHAASAQIAGTVAIDPLNIAAVGASALARWGVKGTQLVRLERAAQEALKAADLTGDAAKIAEARTALETITQGVTAGNEAKRANVLATLGKQKWSGDLSRRFGALYESMAESSLGRVAKGTRIAVDPFHLWGDNLKLPKTIEQASEEIGKVAADVHGHGNWGRVVHHIGTTGAASEANVRLFEEGIGTTLANDLRRMASFRYQAMNKWRGTLRDLRGTPVTKAVEDAMTNATRETVTRMKEHVATFTKYYWPDGDIEMLARRAEKMFDGVTYDEWLAKFKELKSGNQVDQLSLYHRATYGIAIKKLHVMRETFKASGEEWLLDFDMEDIVLLNRQTLTNVGIDGIETRMLAAAGDNAAIMAEIEAAKRLYPELRNFATDTTSVQRTAQNFSNHLSDMKRRVPHQVSNAERQNMRGAMKEFDSLISETPETGVFTIGFRPKEEYRWGLDEDVTGTLQVMGDPFFEQVSAVNSTIPIFHGVREVSYNAAGNPIKKVGGRIMDAGEMAGRTLFNGVTGSMVTKSAKGKFVANATKRLGSHIDPKEIEGLWDLMAKGIVSKTVSGLRGVSDKELWDSVRSVTRLWPHAAEYGPRELMLDVMHAYEGDMRTVGVTQKFTGRVKTMLYETTGRNFAGEISEHVWPLMKFRLNPIFQLQEKIEPWILLGGRGGHVSLGRTPNELDIATAVLYKNYIDSSLVNMADQDIAELSAKFAIGNELEILSMDRSTMINHVTKRLDVDAILDVQGTKRLNMLRTFRKGLGETIEGAWEKHDPGQFQKMWDQEALRVGRAIDKDEFAVRVMAENLTANDITVKTFLDENGKVIGWQKNIENAITTGMHSAPQSLGELRNIGMDAAVRRLGIEGPNGFIYADEMALRRGLASGEISMEQVLVELRALGAHDDYVMRFQSALRFNWNDFWRDVKNAYNMDDVELGRIRQYYAVTAERRGMTPTEYLSQVYSPSLIRDGEGAVGSLGASVEMLRGGQDLARLSFEAGSTSADLYKQMARVTSQHLDPSAKRKFIIALIGDEDEPGPLYGILSHPGLDSIEEIESTFSQPEVIDALANKLTSFFQGTAPTGVHRIVDRAELPGTQYIRDSMAAVRDGNMNARYPNRILAENAEDLRREGAVIAEDMPTFRHVRTRNEAVQVQNVQNVRKWHNVDLKPESSRLAPVEQEAMKDYVRESRGLYNRIVDDMGISVHSHGHGQPYANADELRSDLTRVTSNGRRNPRIRVSTDDLWHPIISAEDMYMIRVVNDVYGFGAEATHFGDDAAIMNVASVYTDSSRSVHLTEKWLPNAYETASQKIVGDYNPAEAYEATHGKELVDKTYGTGEQGGDGFVSRTVGPGVHDLARQAPELAQELLDNLGELRRRFPVEFGGIDVFHDLQAGIAVTYSDSTFYRAPSISFSGVKSGYVADPAAREAIEAARKKKWLESLAGDDVKFGVNGVPTTYQIPGNTAAHVGYTRKSDLYHEYGHVIDVHLRKQARIADSQRVAAGGKPRINEDLDYDSPAFSAFMKELRDSGARKRMSAYAQVRQGAEWTDAEMTAELFDLAYNDEFTSLPTAIARRKELAARAADPNDHYTGLPPFGAWSDMDEIAARLGYFPEPGQILWDPDYRQINSQAQDQRFYVNGGLIDTELLDTIGKFKVHMKRLKIDQPNNVAKTAAPNPHAGRTVSEVNAGYDTGIDVVGGRGTIGIEPRVGRMPQEFADRLTGNYLGTGRYSEPNPDIARLAHYARQNMTDASESFFEGIGRGAEVMPGGAPQNFNWSDIFGPAKMDNLNAIPYDYSEGLLWDAAVQSMAAKWEDAFRLQYFAQNRSMLQRSINHPMFGLYPASYMWGKVGPELIKFMALQPFGINTGVGARMLADVQLSVGAQRDNDPAFDAMIEGMGHSAALDFLSFMLPATPWSVPASYPAWMRDFAQQGLEAQRANENGEVPANVDWVSPLTTTVKKVIPMISQTPWMVKGAEEAVNFVTGTTKRPSKTSKEYPAWLAAQYQKAIDEGRVPDPAAQTMDQFGQAVDAIGAEGAPAEEPIGVPPGSPDYSDTVTGADLPAVGTIAIDQLTQLFSQ